MQLLLALVLSAPLVGPAARPATHGPLRVTVTLGEPHVISVESADGWCAPGRDVVPPVPVSPARLELTIPGACARARGPALDTI